MEIRDVFCISLEKIELPLFPVAFDQAGKLNIGNKFHLTVYVEFGFKFHFDESIFIVFNEQMDQVIDHLAV